MTHTCNTDGQKKKRSTEVYRANMGLSSSSFCSCRDLLGCRACGPVCADIDGTVEAADARSDKNLSKSEIMKEKGKLTCIFKEETDPILELSLNVTYTPPSPLIDTDTLYRDG